MSAIVLTIAFLAHSLLRRSHARVHSSPPATNPTEAGPAARPPNIVMILIDDIGWRDTGCYGSRFYLTPNIDALATRGARFTSAYAACPVCSPTRASIMTGKYPPRLGLTQWLPGETDSVAHPLLEPSIVDHLPVEEFNLARALKTARYASASIGKWHLGTTPYHPDRQGFDINIGGNFSGSPPGGYFRFAAPNLVSGGPDDYLTERLTTEAERFMEQNRDRPFFLYLAHYAVHIPLEARQKLVEKYRSRIIPGDRQNNAIYAAMVESVDDSVGRVVSKIEQLGLTDRTLVVFTSDNGGLTATEGPDTPSTSNLPLRGGKGCLYEGGIREPLIMVWPRHVSAGLTVDTPVISNDFYPTFLAAAGIQPPVAAVADGQDLVRLLSGSSGWNRDALYWHYPHYSNQGGKPSGAIRVGDWKLVQQFEDMHVELYNLKQDIGEQHDLSAREPERTAELLRRLNNWRIEVGARMPRNNPAFAGIEPRPPGYRPVPPGLKHVRDLDTIGE